MSGGRGDAHSPVRIGPEMHGDPNGRLRTVARETHGARGRSRSALTMLVIVAALGLAGTAALAARTVTRRQALAIANAISLRHSDLPTLTESSSALTPQEIRTQNKAIACAGGVPLSEAYANTQSPIFQASGSAALLALNSSTTILPSAALVAKDLAAVARARALPCLLAEIETGLSASLAAGGRLASAHAVRLPTIVSGMSQSFALRFTVSIRVSQGGVTSTVPVYADDIGFADGQAEVSLTIDTTVSPPSASLERRLAALLVSRARAALG